MILLLNGSFGIGKTTVARALATRLPRAVVLDPELIGMVLQRLTRAADFQDLRLWRRLTIVALRVVRVFRRNVIVPMAISDVAILEEIRRGLGKDVMHVCLVAPIAAVRERLRRRGKDAGEWELRRAAECCVAHQRTEFAMQIDANRPVSEIVDEIYRSASVPSCSGTEPPA